jgi:hypothetical protein
MSDFADLLALVKSEAETSELLAKATPAADSQDDDAIQAAATDGGEGEGDETEGSEGEDGDGDEEGDDTMGKSMTVRDADGTEHQAVDATDLIKSLLERADKSDETNGALLKSFASFAKSANTTMKQQGDFIKSLAVQVKTLGGQGRGRRAVVMGTELPGTATDLVKSKDESMTHADFMLKANSAYDNGKISGVELGKIDVSLRTKEPIDKTLIAKVIG